MSNNPKSLRIVFAGTPDISAHVLSSLLKENYNIVGVFTQPDRAKGRGKKLEYSPVKTCALAHEIPVFQPLSFKKEPKAIKQLADLNADVMVVIAYGLLLPKVVLETPKQGCINIIMLRRMLRRKWISQYTTCVLDDVSSDSSGAHFSTILGIQNIFSSFSAINLCFF